MPTKTRAKKAVGNPWARTLRPEDCLLLVIDLQEKFVPYLRAKKRVLRSTILLLRAAGVLRIPVVVTEQNPERIGPTVPDIDAELRRLPGRLLLRKDSFSCLGEPKVRAAIAKAKRPTILIAGCETHVCVMQTTLDALAAGYAVHVAGDAVSSRKKLDWQRGLGRIERAGAVTATSEMIVYELLGRSDTPAFKALLPALKGWTASDDDDS